MIFRPTYDPVFPAVFDARAGGVPWEGESGGGVWTPEGVFGAAQIVYFDAHDSPYSGGTITNLGSLGAGANATQSTAGKRATKTAGGAPSGRDVWSFDGTDDTCSTAQLTAVSQPYTVIAVVRSASTANSDYVCDGFDGSNRVGIAVNSSSSYFGYSGGAQFPLTPSITVLNTWHALLYEANGASSTLYAGNVAGTPMDAGANAYRGTSLGSSFDSVGSYLQCLLAEYRVINRLLTADEKQNLSLYQRGRWGV